MNQRVEEVLVGNVGTAFLGQHQEGDHRRAARVEVGATAAVSDRRHPAAAGPAAEHRDLHNHHFRLGLRRVLDHQLDRAVASLGRGDDLPELDARVDGGELLAVDRFNELAHLKLAGGLGGRAFLDAGDLHHKGRLHQLDADADRPEPGDQLRRCRFGRCRGEQR